MSERMTAELETQMRCDVACGAGLTLDECAQLFAELDTVRKERDEARKVADAAVAYCDQLGTFNNIGHPEVHRRRIELADAVGAWFRSRIAPRGAP